MSTFISGNRNKKHAKKKKNCKNNAQKHTFKLNINGNKKKNMHNIFQNSFNFKMKMAYKKKKRKNI